MTWFSRLSLAQRFSLLSFILIFGAMFLVGAWTGRQIEIGVINRTAALTALYVDSLISHHLQEAMRTGATNPAHAQEVEDLLGDSPLGRSLAAYKIWSTEGRIIYSSQPALVGLRFPIEGGLEAALDGSVHAEITDLNEPEEVHEKQRWTRLIETYAPLSGPGEGEVIGAIEFYQTTAALEAQIRAAQFRSWLVLGTCAVVIFLLLARLIYRASSTISHQRNELQDKVTQLTALLEQNEQLHNRVSRAAARTTALNERFLSRISADLHDGPGQDLALALLRIDELAEICESCRVALRKKGAAGQDFRMIRTALTSALADLRATLAGLRLPEIDELSLGQTAERAVRDFERKTGAAVAYSHGDLPDEAPLSVKITLYRIVQEALSNAFRHANGASQRVSIESSGGALLTEIADSGDGFDPRAVDVERLGLAGMRERVEILGGLFEMESAPGRGTVIRTSLPLGMPEDGSD
ncbi:MAG: sensor histidine kinase [Chloroflexota bacterium]